MSFWQSRKATVTWVGVDEEELRISEQLQSERITTRCLSTAKAEMKANMFALRLLDHAERIETQVAYRV